MEYLTRLTWNSRSWDNPSGRKNKCKGVNNYECECGFGWEEWLFNKNHQCNGYQYGFIQCFSADSHRGKTFKNVHLFTRKCEGSCETSSKGTIYYVGMIKELEVLKEGDPCYPSLINKNKKRMRKEVEDVGSDIACFDREPEEIEHWFNVRFKNENVEFNKTYQNTKLPFVLKNFQLMYNLLKMDFDNKMVKVLEKLRT